MKFAGTLAAGLLLGAAPAFAQSVPKERSEIAYPGRAEPLGERVLATSRQQRRRKLRLEAERGRPLLPDHRQKHHLPAGRRAPDRQLSAHKGIPWRADNPKGSGCSVIGLGVDKDGNFLFGDLCSGRLWGTAWDKSANKWQMQELIQTQLQFTGGNVDEDGSVPATNCYCFYTDDKGATNNPPGALWRVMATDKVPAGAETAKTLKAASN
jgi:hypothetical protein